MPLALFPPSIHAHWSYRTPFASAPRQLSTLPPAFHEGGARITGAKWDPHAAEALAYGAGRHVYGVDLRSPTPRYVSGCPAEVILA